jgi:hypothetical protein
MESIINILAKFIVSSNTENGVCYISEILTSYGHIYIIGDLHHIKSQLCQFNLYQLYEAYSAFCIDVAPYLNDTDLRVLTFRAAVVERMFKIMELPHTLDGQLSLITNLNTATNLCNKYKAQVEQVRGVLDSDNAESRYLSMGKQTSLDITAEDEQESVGSSKPSAPRPKKENLRAKSLKKQADV